MFYEEITMARFTYMRVLQSLTQVEWSILSIGLSLQMGRCELSARKNNVIKRIGRRRSLSVLLANLNLAYDLLSCVATIIYQWIYN